MQAMKCDRCGKFYEEYEGILVHTELKCKTYDLCPDCMKELEDFLENTNERSTN